MRIIGLTGPSGSGKGALGEIFASVGIPSIDTDKVYHALLVPPSACFDELVGEFGNGILCDGHIDRKALANIVFSDTTGTLQNKLNAITHKYVIEKTWQILAEYEKQGKAAAVIDAPLLIEAGIDKKCDLNICVLADEALRMERIITRDGLGEEAAKMRLAAQKPNEFYMAATNYVLYNNDELRSLRASLFDILKTEGIAVET